MPAELASAGAAADWTDAERTRATALVPPTGSDDARWLCATGAVTHPGTRVGVGAAGMEVRLGPSGRALSGARAL
jgi:hypothetical protein